MTRLPVIGVTLGDPAGIGPEIVAKAACDGGLRSSARLLAIGPADSLRAAAEPLGLRVEVGRGPTGTEQAGTVALVDVRGRLEEVQPGRVCREAGRLAVAALEAAVRLALAGEIDAVATAPWNKEAVRLVGDSAYTGHTERLAELTGRDPRSVSMMLVHDELRVFHVTTHVPLRTVAELVRRERVLDVIRLADHVLRGFGVEAPRLAVAGLNPHAGERGLFGDEDGREIAPAIAEAQAAGIDASGPIPGDTVFVRALRGEFDAVVAMYHDQGHIPVKLAGMGHGVNVTVGLPIIRTSVDHGTAFDIVGRGVAEASSLVEAIRLAAELVERNASLDRPTP